MESDVKSSVRWFRSFVVGAFFGGALATWLAPKVIAWYWTPPVEYGINCKAPIVWGLERFQISQVVGVLGGGLVAMILYLFFKSKRNRPSQTL